MYFEIRFFLARFTEECSPTFKAISIAMHYLKGVVEYYNSTKCFFGYLNIESHRR